MLLRNCELLLMCVRVCVYVCEYLKISSSTQALLYPKSTVQNRNNRNGVSKALATAHHAHTESENFRTHHTHMSKLWERGCCLMFCLNFFGSDNKNYDDDPSVSILNVFWAICVSNICYYFSFIHKKTYRGTKCRKICKRVYWKVEGHSVACYQSTNSFREKNLNESE